MSLLKHAIRSHFTLQSLKPRPFPLSSLCQSPKGFCTVPPPKENIAVDEINQNSGKDFVYAKFQGRCITGYTLKSDIIHLLQAINLTPSDIKFGYAPDFSPTKVLIKFPSGRDFDNAVRSIGKKDRLYRFTRIDSAEWNALKGQYDGKTLLLQGIPRNALLDDVERFLSGCVFDASSIQMFMRNEFRDPVRMALVRFPTATDAMNALIMKHRGFCLNNQISVQLLN